MQSKAATVQAYLAELPPDRRAAISAVRGTILKNLDKGYEEGMAYGMIGYYIPHSIYPAGYHCDPTKPLPFATLASQKNHMSVGMMCTYNDNAEEKWLRAAWAKTGKRLDMGKCCIRFKRLEDLPLDIIGEAIRRVPVKKFLALYESALLTVNKAAAARAVARKPGTRERTKAKTPRAKPRRAGARQKAMR